MIAICPNPYRDSGCELSLKIEALLKSEGYETCLCPIFAEEGNEILPDTCSYRKLEEVAGACSLIVVVGGDGTILSAARQVHEYAVPLLGINLGSKGFMAILEPEDYACVVQAARGEYTLSKRMKLDVTLLRAGVPICQDSALNDVVLHGYGDCIKITARCNGKRITGFSGDGVILSTPTGSTGYSMSAGGPIVEPNSESIILSPICAHMMSARSFVLGPDSVITIEMEKLHTRRAYLAVDGNNLLDLASGDTIVVRRSESCTWLADLGLRNFYELAYEKLR